jgi:D-alanyl-D-alanine carboxypeptidase
MTFKARWRWQILKALFLGVFVASMISGCGGGSDDGGNPPVETPADRRARLGAALQKVLSTSVAEQKWLPGVIAAVDFPAAGLRWSGAAGVSNLQNRQPLTPDFSFRIASVTKTFLSAAIHRQVGQGSLHLQDTLDRLLPENEQALLNRYGYRIDRITVAHLLAHTSGLPDFAETSEYLAAVLADPSRRWTRWEQIEFAVSRFARVGEPGQTFVYADTGYLLLGEILEQRGGLPLAEAYRYGLDFARLGLSSTWLESLEPEPAGAKPRLSQYFGDLDINATDPSFDLYGGGGLVSTAADLNRFIAALFSGQVVNAASLASMTTATVEPRAGRGLIQYRLGATDCWGHEGFWGVLMMHCPTEGVSLSLVLTANAAAAGSTFDQGELAQRLWTALELP